MRETFRTPIRVSNRIKAELQCVIIDQMSAISSESFGVVFLLMGQNVSFVLIRAHL